MSSKKEAYVETFMKTLAGEGIAFNTKLKEIFTGVLLRQLEEDEDGNVTQKGNFDTLAKVFTFVATPNEDRPPSPMSYTADLIQQAKDAAAAAAGDPIDPSIIEQSIDGTAFSETPETFDAGTGSFKFMDDAMVNTNVIIENFSSNDAISISNAEVSEYSFFNEGKDVTISLNYNDAGIVTNTIKLTGVVNSDDLVYNHATFVDATGFDPFIS